MLILSNAINTVSKRQTHKVNIYRTTEDDQVYYHHLISLNANVDK